MMKDLNAEMENHVFKHLYEGGFIRGLPGDPRSDGYMYVLDLHRFPLKNLLTEIK